MKKVLKSLILIVISFLMTGCTTINQNLVLDKDGSGSAGISIVIDQEYEDKALEYLNNLNLDQNSINKSYYEKDKKSYVEYTIINEFNDYNDLGYNKNELSIETKDDKYIFNLNLSDKSVSNIENQLDEIKENIKDVKMYLNLTINGYLITNVNIIKGNYDNQKSSIFPAETTFSWDMSSHDTYELIAELGAPIYENYIISISLLSIIVCISIIFYNKKRS